MGIHRLKLLTNNPRKIAGLGGYGLKVESRVPLVICPGDHNAAYLEIKRKKLGHMLGEDTSYQTNQLNESLFIILWDSKITINSIIKNNIILSLLERYSLYLNQESSTRLLALLQKPEFSWNICSINSKQKNTHIDIKIIESLLSNLCNYKDIKKIAIFRITNKSYLYHPPQSINKIEKSIHKLKEDNIINLKNIDSTNQTDLIIWS